MSETSLVDMDYLPTNSHALIRALKAALQEYRVPSPDPNTPLDIHYARIQREAGAHDLIDELYEMMQEDLEEQDAARD